MEKRNWYVQVSAIKAGVITAGIFSGIFFGFFLVLLAISTSIGDAFTLFDLHSTIHGGLSREIYSKRKYSEKVRRIA